MWKINVNLYCTFNTLVFGSVIIFFIEIETSHFHLLSHFFGQFRNVRRKAGSLIYRLRCFESVLYEILVMLPHGKICIVLWGVREPMTLSYFVISPALKIQLYLLVCWSYSILQSQLFHALVWRVTQRKTLCSSQIFDPSKRYIFSCSIHAI